MNMSLGFSYPPPDMAKEEFELRIKALRMLIREMVKANVLVVTAIGNAGPGHFGFPGAFEEVIGVGAVDFAKKIASFSGSGTADKVAKPDVVGYGVGVYSSIERDYFGRAIYRRLSGTSMAAPYVTGIAALYRCHDPNMSVQDVQQQLLQNCEPLEDQPQDRIGKGLARFKV
jgi:subtilisin family serine protease